ncbi:uncharacterized protein [Penaeus vannamei]|uniref:uncharacterized protein isoform X1 n=1 Tax=Penaeus vannamei TaxID=6689 RepID=UPI000F68F2FE|nr:uncharacterized protein LOC113803876 isoform X1 [Penaeus vannamei]
MSGRSAVLCVGVALAVVGVAWAAVPGPNDPRYPDYIVDPRVTCTKEGSFHHPRNCSWYYRCVDRMKIGYFWTYHFECEPGTVFADELDQCVHPFLAAPPCGSPPTTTTTEVVPCTGVEGTCKTYDICRPQRAKKTFCAEIRCNLRTSNLRCPAGMQFDMSSEQCAFPPKESDLCNVFECVGVPGTCTTYKVCRPTASERVLCGKMQCSGHSTPLTCSPGKKFDVATRQCMTPPSENELCAVDTSITIVEEGQLKCSYDNLYPINDFTSRLHCKSFSLCDAGTFRGEKKLCETYYECYRAGSEWRVRSLSCVAGLLYSHAEGKCVAPPTAAELCRS